MESLNFEALVGDYTPVTQEIVSHLVLGGDVQSAPRSRAFEGVSRDALIRKFALIEAAMRNATLDDLSDEALLRADSEVERLRSMGIRSEAELLLAAKKVLRVLSLDDALRARIQAHVARFELPRAWGEEWERSFSNRTVFTLEKQDGDHLIARVPRETRIDSRLAWFSTRAGYGLGTIDSIVKEGVSEQTVRIVPWAAMTEEGLITDGFGRRPMKVRGVPVIPISDGAFERLLGALVPQTESIVLGARISGGRPVFRGTTALPQEEVLSSVIADFEARVPLIGLPGSGKTTLANQILRRLAQHTHLPIVAISPGAPNLAEFGGRTSVIANNPAWNAGGVGESMIAELGSPLPNFGKLTLSERDAVPDINTLHVGTLVELLVVISKSPQMRTIWAARFAQLPPSEVLEQAASGSLFSTHDGFEPMQARTAMRYASVLRSMLEGAPRRVDIGAYVDRARMRYRHLGVHIPSDSAFVTELTFLVLSELFHRAANVHNPREEGIVLALDEIPFIAQSPGAMLPGMRVIDTFSRIVRQGRNRGILVTGLLQDEAFMRHAFPGDAAFYPVWSATREGEARIVSTPRRRAWIAPIAFDAASGFEVM